MLGDLLWFPSKPTNTGKSMKNSWKIYLLSSALLISVSETSMSAIAIHKGGFGAPGNFVFSASGTAENPLFSLKYDLFPLTNCGGIRQATLTTTSGGGAITLTNNSVYHVTNASIAQICTNVGTGTNCGGSASVRFTFSDGATDYTWLSAGSGCYNFDPGPVSTSGAGTLSINTPA
jgi:hypothetical protein